MHRFIATLGLAFSVSTIDIAQGAKTLVPPRANAGEQVAILFSVAPPDKRAAMDAFMKKFLEGLDRATQKDPSLRGVRDTSRVLFPSTPTDKGCWVYVFLLDPKLAEGDYDMDAIIRRVHSRDETTAMMREYRSAMGFSVEPSPCEPYQNLVLQPHN